MLRIGAVGFGGGPALIPVFEKELVHDRHLLDETTFMTHTIVANVTPGAQPVKLAALAGMQLRNVRAAVLGALAVALPGALVTVLLLASFAAIGPQAVRWVEFAAVGITAFILVLLGLFVNRCLSRAAHRRAAFLTIMALSFAATGTAKAIALIGALFGLDLQLNLPHLNALGLIVTAIVLIGVYCIVRPEQRHDQQDQEIQVAEITTWSGIVIFGLLAVASLVIGVIVGGWRGLQYLFLVLGSTLTSFGGGEAYVGVADGFFVRGGFVSNAEFYGQLIPVVNALPGPVLVKVVSGLSYSFGLGIGGPAAGAGLAVAGFTLAVASCSAVAVLVLAGYDRFQHSVFMRRLGFYIMPVICGLLATTSCSMVLENIQIGGRAGVTGSWVGWGTLAGVGVLWWLHHRFGLSDLVLLGLGGGSSLLILGLTALH